MKRAMLPPFCTTPHPPPSTGAGQAPRCPPLGSPRELLVWAQHSPSILSSLSCVVTCDILPGRAAAVTSFFRNTFFYSREKGPAGKRIFSLLPGVVSVSPNSGQSIILNSIEFQPETEYEGCEVGVILQHIRQGPPLLSVRPGVGRMGGC